MASPEAESNAGYVKPDPDGRHMRWRNAMAPSEICSFIRRAFSKPPERTAAATERPADAASGKNDLPLPAGVSIP